MAYIRNIFIISLLTLAFGVALFEKQMVPYLAIKKYDKNLFGFDVNFTPRWVPFFPFASMPMYSDNFDPGVFTDIEVIGVDEKGNELFLDYEKYFYPAWSDAFREVFSNQIYHGMSFEEFAAHMFVLFLKRTNIDPDFNQSIKKIKIESVTWDLNEWLKMRKSVSDIHKLYDWRKTKFKPKEVNVLSEVSRAKALSYVYHF